MTRVSRRGDFANLDTYSRAHGGADSHHRSHRGGDDDDLISGEYQRMHQDFSSALLGWTETHLMGEIGIKEADAISDGEEQGDSKDEKGYL